MATIRKRGKGYQIDYFDPAGKRVRKSFKKKKEAEAELGKRVACPRQNTPKNLHVTKLSQNQNWKELLVYNYLN